MEGVRRWRVWRGEGGGGRGSEDRGASNVSRQCLVCSRFDPRLMNIGKQGSRSAIGPCPWPMGL